MDARSRSRRGRAGESDCRDVFASAAFTLPLHAPTANTKKRKNRRNEGGTMLTKHADLSPEHEAIVSLTIGCAIDVHRELGPGFKESIYHTAFRLELQSNGISFESEKAILVKYRQWTIPGQRIDL